MAWVTPYTPGAQAPHNNGQGPVPLPPFGCRAMTEHRVLLSVLSPPGWPSEPGGKRPLLLPPAPVLASSCPIGRPLALASQLATPHTPDPNSPKNEAMPGVHGL